MVLSINIVRNGKVIEEVIADTKNEFIGWHEQ